MIRQFPKKGFTPLEISSTNRKTKFLTGFTLLELMLAAGVLIVAISGLIAAFIGCYCLNETARNLTFATMGAQEKLEEIRNHNFYKIYQDYYNGSTFGVTGIAEAKGRVDVDNTNPDLLEITVTICWKQVGGRIIGEARDVGGNLVIEDIDGDGKIESPVQLVTLMTKR
jgi:Tfp pilus assembly protein PilV